jgi:L-fucose mutarotase
MLTTPLIHPQILAALGRAGHGATVLIADANYPSSTKTGPRAEHVWLNVRPGLVAAAEVLEPLAAVLPIEAAWVMAPLGEGPYALEGEPEVWADYRHLLSAAGQPTPLDALERQVFYERASADDLALVIVTGDGHLYANLLLRIGARQA